MHAATFRGLLYAPPTYPEYEDQTDTHDRLTQAFHRALRNSRRRLNSHPWVAHAAYRSPSPIGTCASHTASSTLHTLHYTHSSIVYGHPVERKGTPPGREIEGLQAVPPQKHIPAAPPTTGYYYPRRSSAFRTWPPIIGSAPFSFSAYSAWAAVTKSTKATFSDSRNRTLEKPVTSE